MRRHHLAKVGLVIDDNHANQIGHVRDFLLPRTVVKAVSSNFCARARHHARNVSRCERLERRRARNN
jgi:hypothetical protein